MDLDKCGIAWCVPTSDVRVCVRWLTNSLLISGRRFPVVTNANTNSQTRTVPASFQPDPPPPATSPFDTTPSAPTLVQSGPSNQWVFPSIPPAQLMSIPGETLFFRFTFYPNTFAMPSVTTLTVYMSDVRKGIQLKCNPQAGPAPPVVVSYLLCTTTNPTVYSVATTNLPFVLWDTTSLVVGTDNEMIYNFPLVPQAISVSGCQVDSTGGVQTVQCACNGGAVMSVQGVNLLRRSRSRSERFPSPRSIPRPPISPRFLSNCRQGPAKRSR
jgi:hypothetical protein